MSKGEKVIFSILSTFVLIFILWHFDLLSVVKKGNISRKDINSSKTIFWNRWGKTIERNFYRRCQQSLQEIHDDQNLKVAISFCQKELSKFFSSHKPKVKVSF